MKKQDIIKYGLSLPNTFLDMPFEDDDSIVLKHKQNKKWFALFMDVSKNKYLNVKTEPEYSELLRATYEYIIPAYHMNKQHWNTIIYDKKVDESIVYELINRSYELTKPKIARAKRGGKQ